MIRPTLRRGRRPEGTAKRRKRFKFTLNGLAIQLSAFALSFTLVALLVVSGSQAAFVEKNETVTNYVPVDAAPTTGDREPHGSSTAVPPVATPSAAPTSLPGTPTPEPTPPTESEAPVAKIELTDNDAGTAMFGDLTLVPGVTVERCIEVTYTGSVDPGPVELYAAETSGDLTSYLDLAVYLGSADEGSFGDCASFTSSEVLFEGTLADFAAAHSTPATGRSTWDPAGDGERRTFSFRLTMRNDPAAAGKSATFGFSWRTEAS